MKILEIVFSLLPGGAERFVVDLSNELSKSNDVTLLALKDDKVFIEERNFYKYDLSSSVKYDCLNLKDGLTPGVWHKIRKYINVHHPDIVHYHTSPMIYWMIIPMFFTLKDIRFVQTIHSDIHNGYDTFLYRLMTTCFKKKLSFVALSPKNYQELVDTYPDIYSTCILNGRSSMVPTSDFNSVKMEMESFKNDESTLLFLHVARCDKVKNQKRLIDAFNAMSEDCDCKLVIIGAGFDSQLGNELKAISGKNIHFIGTRKNIADYFLNSDVFCLSSDYEGMPITLLEALICGVPVVSTSVCGAVDVVRDGFNGTLAADFSTKAYENALRRMYRNFPVYKANAFSEKETGEYTIKSCSDKYQKFFQSAKMKLP